MKLALHYFSRGRCNWADEAAQDYARRLNRYASFREFKHKPIPSADRHTGQRKEASRVLDQVRPRDQLIVIDERGEALSSEELAKGIEQAQLSAVGCLVFAIGGPYGHHDLIRQKAHQTVRLSTMVLNHQVARVMLLEQLYRAWSIIKGEPYHHA